MPRKISAKKIKDLCNIALDDLKAVDINAFDVECEFGKSEGLTILKPNEWNKDGFTFPPTEDKRCTEANCFTHSFKYPASNGQIEVFSNIKFLLKISKIFFRY